MVPSVAQAKTKAGGGCSKLGATTTISGAKYHCAKSGKSLVWVKSSTSIKSTQSSPTTTSKRAQTITAPQVKAVEITDEKFAGSFTASSKLPVSVSTTSPLICSVQGNSISPLQTGTCEISATQSGNEKYLPAQPLNFSLEVKPPTVTSDNALLDQVQSYIRVPKGSSYASDTAEIALTAVTDDATSKICGADPTADGCILSSGAGIADPNSQTRYVEFAFHVKNLDSIPLPPISYRLLLGGVLADVSAGVSLETLNGLTVGSGESADGSLFAMVPINQKFDGAFLMIDEGITDPSIKLLLSLN